MGLTKFFFWLGFLVIMHAAFVEPNVQRFLIGGVVLFMGLFFAAFESRGRR